MKERQRDERDKTDESVFFKPKTALKLAEQKKNGKHSSSGDPSVYLLNYEQL